MTFCGSAEKGKPQKEGIGEFGTSIVGEGIVKEKYRFGLKEEKNWNISLLDEGERLL